MFRESPGEYAATLLTDDSTMHPQHSVSGLYDICSTFGFMNILFWRMKRSATEVAESWLTASALKGDDAVREAAAFHQAERLGYQDALQFLQDKRQGRMGRNVKVVDLEYDDYDRIPIRGDALEAARFAGADPDALERFFKDNWMINPVVPGRLSLRLEQRGIQALTESQRAIVADGCPPVEYGSSIVTIIGG
jgi:hypothetical protein